MTKFRKPNNVGLKGPKKLNLRKYTDLAQCDPNPPNC